MTTYDVERHIALARVTALAAAPDGTWLAVAVQRLDLAGTGYVSDLWRVPTDGGPAVQLTRGDGKDTAPCFRHDGALGFLSNRRPVDRKGDDEADKRSQVWLLPAQGGEPVQLTDEPLGVEALRFARHADRLVLLAPVLHGVPHGEQREAAARRAKQGPSARHYTRQPVRHWDHWLHERDDRPFPHLIACTADGRDRVDLTPQARREFALEPELAVSADGRLAAVTRRTPGPDRVDDVSVLLADLAAGQTRVLAHAACTQYESLCFSPDGRWLAATRGRRSPQRVVQQLVLLDTAGGTERELAAAWDRWATPAAWSRDGAQLIVTADDGGHVPVFAVEVDTGVVRRLTAAAAGGTHSDVAALADGRIAAIRSTLLDAPEVCVFEPAEDAAAQPLARLSGFVPADAWAESDRFTVASTDGAPIQCFITRPRGAGPWPTLLWIHGGPINMSHDGWHWRWNPLLAVAQGYAVVQPNPRGSTGFGQAFIDGIWGNTWGDQCFKDIMAVADALQARPDVDPGRIMAMGGSFGGYMTNWIGTQTSRFRCLITHASIVGMATFTGVTDHPGWWYLEMGGENPYRDLEAFDRYAPWRFLSQWKTPTLVIHGELDYRCPIGEGLMLFEALQYHGVDSELLVFPDENHWILKPRNIVAWYEAVLGFLGRHLQ